MSVGVKRLLHLKKIFGNTDEAIEAAAELGRRKGRKNARKTSIKKAYRDGYEETKGVIKQARPVSDDDTVSKAIQYENAAKQKYGFDYNGNSYSRTGSGSQDDPYQYFSRANKNEAWSQISNEDYTNARNNYITSQRQAGHQADISAAYDADVAKNISQTAEGDADGIGLVGLVQQHPYVAMGVAAGGGILAANLLDDDY